MFINIIMNIDDFLKNVYYLLKEVFTEKENPLYNQFYDNEEIGFARFKSNVDRDDRLFWIYKRESFTDDDVKSTTSQIINTINRYYYMSKQ